MRLITVDFDGTLFQGDSFQLMFEAGKKQFGIKEWSKVTTGSLEALALGMLKGKNALRIHFFKSFAKTFKGKSEVEINTFFAELIEQGRRQISSTLLEMIEHEKKQGNEVILLSGALEPFLYALVEDLNIDIPVIGTPLEYDENQHCTGNTGVYIGGEEKVIAIKKWLERKGLHHEDVHIVAYADSESDIPLLQFADESIVVNPKEKMKRLADSYTFEIYSK